jgi:transglutaminase-like putative cysteine protease
MNKASIVPASSAIAVFLLVASSAWGAARFLRIPIGQTASRSVETVCLVDTVEVRPAIETDSHGGEWYRIALDSLATQSVITLDLCVELTNWRPYNLESTRQYLDSCTLIDSENPDVADLAALLVGSTTTNNSKALAIFQYVIDRIQYRQYSWHFEYKASDTLKMKYGTCVNMSRLFVALCRAAKIPARTIWGVVDGPMGVGHHEWAEFVNDSGEWQQVDPSFTRDFTLCDTRYLDLINCSEENEYFRELYKPYRMGEDYVYLSTKYEYTADLGYRLVRKGTDGRSLFRNSYLIEDFNRYKINRTMIASAIKDIGFQLKRAGLIR